MRFIFVLLLIANAQIINAQSVGVGTTNPNSTAMLDVNAANRYIIGNPHAIVNGLAYAGNVYFGDE